MQNTPVKRLCLDAGAAGLLGVVLSVVIGVDRMLPASHQPNAGGPGKMNLLAPSSPYALRVAENKEDWIAEYGGTKKSEAAVAAGLDWLVRHQGKDGSWSQSHLSRGPNGVCEENAHCGGAGQDFPFAQTGLAVLALQAAGNFEFNDARYSDAVRRGLHWLAEHQSNDGLLCHGMTPTHMYEHGMAAFALSESCAAAKAFGKPPDPQILAAATKGIGYIEKHQHNDGGWRYSDFEGEGSDTSVSGWQVLALKSAHGADIPFSDECTRKVKYFFQRCESGNKGRTGYTTPAPLTDATTGVGMLVHQFLLNDPDADLVKQAAPYLAKQAEDLWGRNRLNPDDYYLWYNCTLAMCMAGGDPWNRWNAVVRDLVMSRQEGPGSGCARGSWPPSDRYGGAGGRIYSTALAVLTLEVYYRFAKVKAP
jgi:hypothetical protein